MKKPSNAAVQMRKQLFELDRYRPLRDPLAVMSEVMSEDLNLTAPQTHTVLRLGIDGSLPMGALARRSGITEKSMTGVIDRLEQMGFAERVRSSEDRRSVSVVLTAKGRDVSKQIVALVDAGLEHLFELLGPNDHKLLLGIIERTAEKMKALNEARGVEQPGRSAE